MNEKPISQMNRAQRREIAQRTKKPRQHFDNYKQRVKEEFEAKLYEKLLKLNEEKLNNETTTTGDTSISG